MPRYTGTTTDHHETITDRHAGGGSYLDSWGCIKNTHASASLRFRLVLTDAFGKTSNEQFTVAAGGVQWFSLRDQVGNAYPPFTDAFYQVRDGVVGQHATYELELGE